ncbi:MAG: PQQ-like beta-propeller repeat protein [Acidobacteriota bacterium]|nr:PQQ-like beta-propeller repeat protein [Acidobacteriota bacterium]
MRRHLTSSLCVVLATSAVVSAGVVLATATVPAQSPSWPQWRGPARDGVAAFDAPATWPRTLTRAWDAVVGAGHASPVIAGSRVVVHTRQGEREVVTAFDLDTGTRLWQDAYDAPYQINPAAQAHGPGPKSTPAVAGGRVLTLGISGVLSAYDLATGRVQWRTLASPTLPLYGTATSPLVDGDRVIAFLGGHDRGALTAFDAATGSARWRWTGDGPGYASPVIAELDGTRQLVTQSQSQLVGLAADDGRLLWQVPLRTNFDQNSVTPLVVGGLVISSGLENPTIAYRVSRGAAGWQAQEAWRNEQVSMYMSSPAAGSQAIFTLSHRNRGQFVALDPATGRTLWTTRGREGDNASIIRAGPWLLLSTTNGELIVARASAERFDEVRRYVVAESVTWAHPAVAGRTIVVKDVDRLVVWRL